MLIRLPPHQPRRTADRRAENALPSAALAQKVRCEHEDRVAFGDLSAKALAKADGLAAPCASARPRTSSRADRQWRLSPHKTAGREPRRAAPRFSSPVHGGGRERSEPEGAVARMPLRLTFPRTRPGSLGASRGHRGKALDEFSFCSYTNRNGKIRVCGRTSCVFRFAFGLSEQGTRPMPADIEKRREGDRKNRQTT
jgi:hypothetical protein